MIDLYNAHKLSTSIFANHDLDFWPPDLTLKIIMEIMRAKFDKNTLNVLC